jgi:uncharacterized membrane protein YbhN (UPF0104 family)
VRRQSIPKLWLSSLCGIVVVFAIILAKYFYGTPAQRDSASIWILPCLGITLLVVLELSVATAVIKRRRAREAASARSKDEPAEA